MKMEYNGLGTGLGNLARLSNAETRSISAENFTGGKGMGGMATEGTGAAYARELGRGWKISPSIYIQPKELVTLAEIEGPGAIQHIWMTIRPEFWRCLILRVYWDRSTFGGFLLQRLGGAVQYQLSACCRQSRWRI